MAARRRTNRRAGLFLEACLGTMPGQLGTNFGEEKGPRCHFAPHDCRLVGSEDGLQSASARVIRLKEYSAAGLADPRHS